MGSSLQVFFIFDANFRTVNLMFFFQVAVLRTGELTVNSISQFEIIANETFIEVDFQYAHYFGIKKEVEMLFNSAKTNVFGWDG